MKDAVKQIIDQYKISNQNAQIGVITYGRYATRAISIGEYTNKRSLLDAVNRLRNPGDGARLDLGLNLASDMLKSVQESGVPQKLIVLMDQKAVNDVLPSMTVLRENNVEILVVGIGSEIDSTHIVDISNGNGQIITDGDDLVTIIIEIVQTLTKGKSKIFLYL